MNACCSIVKFFVVLMNLVFWVSIIAVTMLEITWTGREKCSSGSFREGKMTFSRGLEDSRSREKRKKRHPYRAHQHKSAEHRVLLGNCAAKGWRCVERFSSSRWRSLVNMASSAQFPWKGAVKKRKMTLGMSLRGFSGEKTFAKKKRVIHRELEKLSSMIWEFFPRHFCETTSGASQEEAQLSDCLWALIVIVIVML